MALRPVLNPLSYTGQGFLGIILTKEVKELYLENYRTLKKKTEEDTNKWKHIPGS